MKKILMKISRVLQVVLMAPIKLPGKALNILKYIALGLGVVETVLDKEESLDDSANRVEPHGTDDKNQSVHARADEVSAKQELVRNKEMEVPDENE
ncbi:hypothetical protein KO02_09040 [Sphingobacterium sp. ML3W]|uniref:hypothetical protein n=1 Tax=Sphingobacterium sp. ML3W TaxID=1538644 RepID=UPI0004F698AB|nr:hypothetical protein [Sphingobacterium sp. ML3W]AIM36830.1 hypothetical protein KO02_09040 [Sphingobacterium sp. ML3W]